jgi:hypothetical protein
VVWSFHISIKHKDITVTFTHTERKTLKFIDEKVLLPLDLRGTMEDLKRRGYVKTRKGPDGFPKPYVVKSALEEIYRKPEPVDPKRVNVNTGILIDVDE